MSVVVSPAAADARLAVNRFCCIRKIGSDPHAGTMPLASD
jgi:hypothetical protein